jgi:hypothetical protein
MARYVVITVVFIAMGCTATHLENPIVFQPIGLSRIAQASTIMEIL